MSGLICISDATFDSCMYLWNPSIRKMKRLPKCLICYTQFAITTLGFGFDCGENDYKVVRIVRTGCAESICEAEVYSVRLDSWRRIRSYVPLVSHNAYLQDKSACLNGVVYWIVEDFSLCCYSILSFDLRSKSFQTMTLPERLVSVINTTSNAISIQVLKKSLSLFHLRQNVNDRYCDIWVLFWEGILGK
nr:F-box/kelch-repeat protein At3g06240-like [Malus domestica]